MDGIKIVAENGKIHVVTTVGTKAALVKITPDYARKLAAALMVAAESQEAGAGAGEEWPTVPWLLNGGRDA